MKSSVMGHALYLGKISPERILFEDMSSYKLMWKHDLMLTLHVLGASITESSTLAHNAILSFQLHLSLSALTLTLSCH